MTRKFKTYLIIFIASILVPYITFIFFILTSSLLVIIPIFFIALFFLITSTIGLYNSETVKLRKKYYWFIAFSTIILFFFSYSFQLKTAKWIFLKIREEKLIALVSELKRHKEIQTMSDGQRSLKFLNFTLIEPNAEDVDSTKYFNKEFLLDDILKRDGIDKKFYEYCKCTLIETDLRSFIVLENQTVSFTIDGFSDNCYGIAYSETGIKPENNDCGQIISWNKIYDNWYAWTTT